eukprot:GHVP01000183.1.p1 GENE.GHVP01000183.1~~GHVP01000183.1.p1  ORF type:complete len:168 (-),score=45.49 GHVP01000183.1:43-546(-)
MTEKNAIISSILLFLKHEGFEKSFKKLSKESGIVEFEDAAELKLRKKKDQSEKECQLETTEPKKKSKKRLVEEIEEPETCATTTNETETKVQKKKSKREPELADLSPSNSEMWKKRGDSFSLSAGADLSRVKGKDFRSEKAKKKRASWRGTGEIDMGVNSIQFEDSD